MTTNQMIVFLDVVRGFDESRHMATADSDLKVLENAGLIRWSFGDWELTPEGTALLKEISDSADKACRRRV